jgi:AcrR family transcriptional regulator
MLRREQTTRAIRDAARGEFSSVGARALSFRAVARAAFVSPGAVYERWPNKNALIADFVLTELPETVREFTQPWQDDSRDVHALIEADLADETRLQQLRFVAQCAYAAQQNPELGAATRQSLVSLGSSIAHRLKPNADLTALTWLCVVTWLGHALICTAGGPVPPQSATFLAKLLDNLSPILAHPGTLRSEDPGSIQSTSAWQATGVLEDPTYKALVRATKRAIAERGVSAIQTRSIAQAAGVTTGAFYRRFHGRLDALLSAFNDDLHGEQLAWASLLHQITALPTAAGVESPMSTLCRQLWTGQEAAHTLLEFTVCVGNQEEILDLVFQELAHLCSRRAVLFQGFAENGIMARQYDPMALAWFLQFAPMGMWLCASLHLTPSDHELEQLFSGCLRALTMEAPQANLSSA